MLRRLKIYYPTFQGETHIANIDHKIKHYMKSHTKNYIGNKTIYKGQNYYQ